MVSTRITAADRTEHVKRLRHTSRLPFAPGEGPGCGASAFGGGGCLSLLSVTDHPLLLPHPVPTVLSPAASSQRPAARPRVPPSLPGGAPEDMRVVAMAQQVKEVLPHVPLEVIRTDLGEQGLGWQQECGGNFCGLKETLSLLHWNTVTARMECPGL